jgi:hypothetical protein
MLYIFGDSFADNSNNVDWSWTYLVAATLGHDQRNFGRGGSGLEYTFEQFEQCRKYITKHDLVIVCLTHEGRGYFFKDFPVLSSAELINYVPPESRKKISRDEMLAIKYYQTNFSDIHTTKMKLHVVNFLHSVDSLAAELKIKIVIINAVSDTVIDCARYTNLIMSDGSLDSVSAAEFATTELATQFDEQRWPDPRPNHLRRSNHAILAKKVVDTITTNVALDLTSGFNEKIIKELTFLREI